MMDAWKFLAGLGLFLFAMGQVEEVLKKLSGYSFKIMLQEQTRSLWKGIVGGALVTALLQSSSVVSTMVLAFVGARVITMRNALGIILGANLGTTVSSWIVATLGFKLDIENWALPIIALTGIGLMFTQQHSRLRAVIQLFLAIGILFLGLAFMKNGAEKMVTGVDFTQFAQWGSFFFVLFGFVLTTIIQSSSATVAITLTALHTGIISFPLAAATVIGSELGTTIKLFYAGLDGNADKRRVAFGNFIFNSATTVMAYTLLYPLVYFIQHIAGMSDPLLGLVMFQSLINFLAILVFVPIIGPFAGWLERRFQTIKKSATLYISREMPGIPALAIDALKIEVYHTLRFTMAYISKVFRVNAHAANGQNSVTAVSLPETATETYAQLKRVEGEILEFHLRLEQQNLGAGEQATIDRYLSAVRKCIQAAKAVKDIQHNLDEIESNANPRIYNHYRSLQTNWEAFLKDAETLLQISQPDTLFDELNDRIKNAKTELDARNNEVINALREGDLPEEEVSSMLNVSRELYLCEKSLWQGVGFWALPADQAEHL